MLPCSARSIVATSSSGLEGLWLCRPWRRRPWTPSCRSTGRCGRRGGPGPGPHARHRLGGSRGRLRRLPRPRTRTSATTQGLSRRGRGRLVRPGTDLPALRGQGLRACHRRGRGRERRDAQPRAPLARLEPLLLRCRPSPRSSTPCQAFRSRSRTRGCDGLSAPTGTGERSLLQRRRRRRSGRSSKRLGGQQLARQRCHFARGFLQGAVGPSHSGERVRAPASLASSAARCAVFVFLQRRRSAAAHLLLARLCQCLFALRFQVFEV